MLRCALAVGIVAAATAAHAGIATVSWSIGDAAFTPTVTSSGTPLHWAGSCVFLRPHSAGAADVPGALEAAVALAAVGWETATRSCGYLRFELEPAEAGEVGLDRVNRIVVREDRWCRPGTPEQCYDPGAIGITTLFYVDVPGDPDDGTILDADIELNAVDYALATCDGQPGGCVSAGTGPRQDLANTLTHELGHLLGLDHTCWAGAPADAPLDGTGARVPPCQPLSSLPPEVTEATMYNFSQPEEIAKRSLGTDDITGLCARYPLAADPGVCAPVPPDEPPPPDASGGCVSSRAPAPALILVVLLALHRRRRPGTT